MVSVIPRPMRPEEDDAVRELRRACFPGAALPPPRWYFAHPTLVIEAAHMLVAFTSFTLSPHAKKCYVCYGVDLCVHPDYRRRGYARVLHEARCEIAKSLGAVDFVATVKTDNAASKALFVALGYRRVSVAHGHEFYVGKL